MFLPTARAGYVPGTAQRLFGAPSFESGLEQEFWKMYNRRSTGPSLDVLLHNNGTNIRQNPDYAKLFDTAFGTYTASQAIRAYSECIGDPEGAPPAPIPFGPGLPRCTAYRSVWEGQADASTTTGVGGVGLNPTMANDQNCVWHTATAYAATSFPSVASVGVVLGAAGNQLPYTTAQLGVSPSSAITSGIRSRLVTAQLQVRNCTAALNRGGRAWLFNATGINPAGLVAGDMAKLVSNGLAVEIDPTAGRWHGLTWTPALLRDFLYPATAAANSIAAAYPPSVTCGGSAATLATLVGPVALFFTSPLNNGVIVPQSYEYRVVIVAEYTGLNYTGIQPNNMIVNSVSHPMTPMVIKAHNVAQVHSGALIEPREVAKRNDGVWSWLSRNLGAAASAVGGALKSAPRMAVEAAKPAASFVKQHAGDIIDVAMALASRGASVPASLGARAAAKAATRQQSKRLNGPSRTPRALPGRPVVVEID